MEEGKGEDRGKVDSGKVEAEVILGLTFEGKAESRNRVSEGILRR